MNRQPTAGRRTLRLLAFQPEIVDVITQPQKSCHIRRLAQRLDAAIMQNGPEDIDLVILPELTTIEYSKEAFTHLSETAEALDGESVEVFRDIARRHSVHVSFSVPRTDRGDYFISNLVINPEGRLVTVYDKVHMAQFGASKEKEFFRRGESLSVFELGTFRVGVIICYDFRFPEYVRHLVEQHKVNLILHPVAFIKDGTFPSWHHFAITRALENQVYLISLNRAGSECGQSIFCPPWIDEKQQPTVFGDNEEVRIFQLSGEKITQARSTYSFAVDRMQDYSVLPCR